MRSINRRGLLDNQPTKQWICSGTRTPASEDICECVCIETYTHVCMCVHMHTHTTVYIV